MIPEREREALMRLTMCARGECPMCKYEEQCDNWDFRMELATKNMNILADALRKTENCSEIPNNCKDEPITQTETQNSNLTFEKRTMLDCYNCKRFETEDECIECLYEPKDEPQTDIHDLTDCDFCKDRNCKDCEGGKDEPQTETSTFSEKVQLTDEPQTERSNDAE